MTFRLKLWQVGPGVPDNFDIIVSHGVLSWISLEPPPSDIHRRAAAAGRGLT